MNQGPDQIDNDQQTPTVLVIDDSIDMHRLFMVRLRSEQLDIVSAMSGEEGIELARKRVPSIILLDLDMPGMDGFEVLRYLKDDADLLDIPVIVLSGLNSSHDKVTAFDLGAHDYVTKPFDMMELRVRVRAALRLSNLLNMLATHAQVDGLTGLWNRACFDRRWAEETASAKRYSRALSLAIFDLDHFKSVNDTFGHPAGDAVLEGFAKLVRSTVRGTDIACRYGGEEFAMNMPETTPGDALALCERIRERLALLVWPKHPERKITVSIGVAGASEGVATSAEEWIETADKTLYTSKTSGRDRVTVTDLSERLRIAS